MQQSVIATWQMSPAEVRGATRAARLGQWQRLTRHTFLATVSPPSDEHLLWAAVLDAGRAARLAGRNALVLHGWQQDVCKPIDVVVPRDVRRRCNPDWMRVHRAAVVRGPAQSPPRVPVHDAAVQSAAWARSDREAMFIVVSALQQGLVEPERLRAATGSKLHRRRVILTIVDEYAGGVDSLSELDFGRLCRRYGVPPPRRQVRRLDKNGKCRSIDVEFVTWEGRQLRAEIEGLQHFDPLRWLEGIERHNSLVLAGEKPWLRVSTWTVRFEPDVFMLPLREAVVGPG